MRPASQAIARQYRRIDWTQPPNVMYSGIPMPRIRPAAPRTPLSRIDASDRLVKEAQVAGRADQAGLDSLTQQLAKGNLNPGIGSKHLFGEVFEARAQGGARVYFRNTSEGIEILAKSVKANQDAVISALRRLYG